MQLVVVMCSIIEYTVVGINCVQQDVLIRADSAGNYEGVELTDFGVLTTVDVVTLCVADASNG